MPFNSFQYFLFLPAVYLALCLVRDRGRWFVLLAASLLFYAALNAPYLPPVLMLAAITTYGFGRWLGSAGTPRGRLSRLWSGIAANVFILAVMKFPTILGAGPNAWWKLLAIPAGRPPATAFVAIGVSFYIFQAISYLIDIYLEIIKPERHFGYLALSLAFFPKLLQGPIERSGDLLPQLKIKFAPDYDNLRAGVLLFTWGLFKKLVIADRLGIYVDAVYNSVHQFTGLALLLATYAYAFQIYLDFSGYTDMALGSARLFNINLTQNFNSPYLATSVADFWRRWHISFSSWILDYIFKPLQMRWRHAKNWGTAAALLVTFLISGIWHGASWKFVLWGLLHGVYLAGSVFYRPFRNKLQNRWGIRDHRLWKAGRIFVTFNLICLAWVLFRANNLADAWYVLSHLFHGTKSALSGLLRPLGNLDAVILAVSALVYLTIGSLIKRHGLSSFNKLPLYQKCLIFYSLSMAIVIFGVFDRAGFLYFIF